MVVLLVVIQFALWAHAAQVTQLAASEGDRVARSVGGSPGAGIIAADAVLDGPGSDVVSGTVVVSSEPGDETQIVVTGHALSVLPWFSAQVSARTVGPVQEFRASE